MAIFTSQPSHQARAQLVGKATQSAANSDGVKLHDCFLQEEKERHPLLGRERPFGLMNKVNY